MSDDINNRIDELLVLAALGELSEAENDELDGALAADSELADDLAADLAVAARLQSIAEVAPPAAVKHSVMVAIKGIAQDATRPPQQPMRTPASPTLGASPQVVPISSTRSRRRQPLAAAAAVTEASDAQRRALVGELDGALDAVWSPSTQAFVLAGTGIPVLSDAETYQLWLIDAGIATPVGIFQPNADGEVEQVFIDVDPSDFIIGVTVEPAGGSDQPSLPVIAAA
jgi:anti-sigma-K factor RskA